jgi:hypothetical protein
LKEEMQDENHGDSINNFANERMKYSQPKLISIYCKRFNIVFDTGIISFLEIIPNSFDKKVYY